MQSIWSVQTAKAKFSQLLDTTIRTKPSLKELLLLNTARTKELVVPHRQDNLEAKRRTIPQFD